MKRVWFLVFLCLLQCISCALSEDMDLSSEILCITAESIGCIDADSQLISFCSDGRGNLYMLFEKTVSYNEKFEAFLVCWSSSTNNFTILSQTNIIDENDGLEMFANYVSDVFCNEKGELYGYDRIHGTLKKYVRYQWDTICTLDMKEYISKTRDIHSTLSIVRQEYASLINPTLLDNRLYIKMFSKRYWGDGKSRVLLYADLPDGTLNELPYSGLLDIKTFHDDLVFRIGNSFFWYNKETGVTDQTDVRFSSELLNEFPNMYSFVPLDKSTMLIAYEYALFEHAGGKERVLPYRLDSEAADVILLDERHAAVLTADQYPYIIIVPLPLN